MRTQFLKRCAMAVLLAAAVLAAASQTATASGTATFDSCHVQCPGSRCEAATSWYVFWDDCSCSCNAQGQATCGCS
jgi:hypothetical protein